MPDGQNMYFKPRESGREQEFDRELGILNKIKRKRLAKGQIRLSDLQAIVVHGDTEGCIGLLTYMIPIGSFGDLLTPECWKYRESQKKWEEQVVATVTVLYAHNIVWGDVNAGNVVID